MSNDLILSNMTGVLATQKPEYAEMLQNIRERMPTIAQDTSNFHKSHSQFMQVTLDVTTLTPIRSIAQTLAEIDQTRMALQSAYIGMRKKQNELARKKDELENPKEPLDVFQKELLEIEILEIETGFEVSQNYVNGALRKMNFFVNQHKQLLEKVGKTNITEEDYEREEARYHIMTAMKQALSSSRPRGGVIDEGNMIYFFELGINCGHAQLELSSYLAAEGKLLSEGKAPTHEMTMKWLEACADLWEKCPEQFAKRRGFSIFDKDSLANPAIEDQTQKTE